MFSLSPRVRTDSDEDENSADEKDRGIKGALRHFSHQHELILVDTSIHGIWWNRCQACDQSINLTSSPVAAMCYICRSYWHKSCLELPQHITHPFHPHHTLTLRQSALRREYNNCNACRRSCNRCCAYWCSHLSCSFCLDLSCAALTPSNTSPSISIPADHKIVCPLSSFSNSSHHLILCDVNYTTALRSFCCSVCGIEFPKQVQEAALYVCLECRITLHGSCAHQLLPRQITNHPIHSEHTLKPYLQIYEHKFSANHIDLGIIYYKCSKCYDFKLHPIFATTTTAVVHKHNNNNNNNQIISHIHPVIHLNFHPHKFVRLLCFACQDAIKDDSVICFCRECSVFLHKSCAALPRQIQHPCHLQHPLTVFDSIRLRLFQITCVACQSLINGYYYECDSCHFYLHCKCAMESIFYPPIKSESHPHPLVYFKSGLKFNKKHCQRCQPSDDWEPDNPIFSCRELTCNFSVHAHCLPKSELPCVVNNIHHLHTLNLTYSQITDDSPKDGSDVELYCDSCEERRRPSKPTYYCADCHFVAHVDCNISEVINHFVKNSTETEEHGNISSYEEKSMASKELLVDMKSGTSKTDRAVQKVKDIDTEIAIQSTELGKLKNELPQLEAKLDPLKQEIEIKSEKLDQLELRRRFASLAHL